MVFCEYDRGKTGKCKKTRGKCILNNPNTVTDFSKCPQKKGLGKEYHEMDSNEKLLTKTRKHDRMISTVYNHMYEMSVRIDKLEEENKFMQETLEKVKSERSIRLIPISAGYTALDGRLSMLEDKINNSKNGRFIKWLLRKK